MQWPPQAAQGQGPWPRAPPPPPPPLRARHPHRWHPGSQKVQWRVMTAPEGLHRFVVKAVSVQPTPDIIDAEHVASRCDSKTCSGAGRARVVPPVGNNRLPSRKARSGISTQGTSTGVVSAVLQFQKSVRKTATRREQSGQSISRHDRALLCTAPPDVSQGQVWSEFNLSARLPGTARMRSHRRASRAPSPRR